MFETWVLICAIGSPLCHTLVDEYGPYTNKKQCITRAYEIAADLPEHMPNYEAVKYKCILYNIFFLCVGATGCRW